MKIKLSYMFLEPTFVVLSWLKAVHLFAIFQQYQRDVSSTDLSDLSVGDVKVRTNEQVSDSVWPRGS